LVNNALQGVAASVRCVYRPEPAVKGIWDFAMGFAKMQFRGTPVWVEVDESGAPVVRNGRATMKYRETDDRVYHPAAQNLTPPNGPEIPVSAVPGSQRRAPGTGPKTESIPETAVVAYTDGGCIGNPGPAGLGYLIVFPDGHRLEKGEPLGQGTNNIAELTAILRVLETIPERTVPLRIFTDSSYAIGMLTQGWKARVNGTLISDIRRKMAGFTDLQLRKVKGHAGHPENERVDQLANESARTQRFLP
jgi:ribonuclease HI